MYWPGWRNFAHDSMEGGGRATQEAKAEDVLIREGHDCMDAGGRAMQERLPRKPESSG